MLTALFSLISGIVSGLAPEIMKEVRESRAAKREREFLEAQHRWQMERVKIEAEDKMREAESAQVAAEIQATRESLAAILETAARPTGIAWIDAFNALLRPVAVTGVMVLFFWVATAYTAGVLSQYSAGHLTVAQLNSAVWGSMVGEGIVAVLSFLFGYRGAIKARA